MKGETTVCNHWVCGSPDQLGGSTLWQVVGLRVSSNDDAAEEAGDDEVGMVQAMPIPAGSYRQVGCDGNNGKGRER